MVVRTIACYMMEHISSYKLPKGIQWGLCFLAAVNSTAVFSNVIIVTVILKTPMLRRKVNNIILLLLLSCHIFVNMEVFSYCLTFWIYKYQQQSYPPSWVGKIHTSIIVGAFNCESYSIVLITLDRFLPITRPFLYQRLRFKLPLFGGISLALVGTVSIIYRQFLTSSSSTSAIVVVCCVIISQVILCVSNFKIYRIVRRQFSQVKSITVAGDDEMKKKLEKDLLKREMIATNICRLIAATYILFTSPLWLDIVFSVLFSDFRDKMPHVISMLVTSFSFVNAIVDPWIYLRSNREVRQELWNSVKKYLQRTSTIRPARST